jgi:glycine cleavage system H protein
MEIRDDRAYSREHLWVLAEGNTATVGITDHAQDELGEIVYLDLPAQGKRVERGESMGEIESIKTVSQLIAPVSGDVTEQNQGAIDKPELVNSAPYTDGWLVRLRLAEDSGIGELLSAADYRTLTDGS